jgi:hypothetical protein
MRESEREAFEAAERLVREAHERAERVAREAAASAPPNGWSSGAAPAGDPFPDLGALIALVESLRGTLPPDLAHQLAEALRQLLLAMRAVLDYTIDRLDRPPGAAEREVQDIPIT